MTAPLINLTDDNLMDLEAWKYGGDNISSMSRLVTSARTHEKAWNTDALAERRLWGRGRFATLRIQHKEFPARTVVAHGIGDAITKHHGWDRLIWTNEPPYHNSARAFRGSEEVA